MELGEKIRQARLEAGLSQRQLCGDTITRNMLSLIESGRAKPGMDTLLYLASRLGKPVGWFLEQEAVTSPNPAVMTAARNAFAAKDYAGARKALEGYRAPDQLFDWERDYLEILCLLGMAEAAEDKPVYALSLLEQAEALGAQTPYYTDQLQRRCLLLRGLLRPTQAGEIVSRLPEIEPELLVRAHARFGDGDIGGCIACLEAAQNRDGSWYLLRGRAAMGQKDYAGAGELLLRAEALGQPCADLLEVCFREQGDYKRAYEYACKQREK